MRKFANGYMALCDHCRAEIAGSAERLPSPPFNTAQQTVYGLPVAHGVWRCLEILYRRRKQGPVSVDSFMTLLYGHMNSPPSDKIMATWICRARGPAALAGWHIVNHHARGYQLVAAGSAEAQADAKRRRNNHRRGNPLWQRNWPPEGRLNRRRPPLLATPPEPPAPAWGLEP
jgi:hypothetical protein